jgi:hypothetical protein
MLEESQKDINAKEQTAASNPKLDAYYNLEDLITRHGSVELRKNANGEIEVRCGNRAAWARRLQRAIEDRVAIDVEPAMNKLMGQDIAAAQQVGTGVLIPGNQAKQARP